MEAGYIINNICAEAKKMKLKLIIYPILFLLCFSSIIGCITTNTIETKSPYVFKAKADSFQPNIKDLHTSSKIKIRDSKPFWDIEGAIWCFLNYQKTNNIEIWTINLFRHGRNWMFVDGIKFLIDGDLLVYTPLGIPNRGIFRGGFSYCF